MKPLPPSRRWVFRFGVHFLLHLLFSLFVVLLLTSLNGLTRAAFRREGTLEHRGAVEDVGSEISVGQRGNLERSEGAI